MSPSASVSMQRRRLLRGGIGSSGIGVRPPWALDEAGFLASCSRCGACVDTCTQRILVRGDGGYPQADFFRGECTFCGDCAAVCEAGALRRVSMPNPPWILEARIGDACLAARGIECRICGECCDAHAIRFVPQLGAVARPVPDASKCSGCGACVAPCPVAAVSVTHLSVINPLESEQ